MVFARSVRFCFKKGKFEDGFSELDLVLNKSVRDSKGFRGFISMVSRDKKDSASIVTFWDDEESLLNSEKQLFLPTMTRIKDALEKEPEVEHFRVFSTEMFSRSPV